jgi:hypothetical protein
MEERTMALLDSGDLIHRACVTYLKSQRPTEKYWALVVRRGDELKRTGFVFGRISNIVVDAAREHGWTPVAYVGTTREHLLRRSDSGLVPVE